MQSDRNPAPGLSTPSPRLSVSIVTYRSDHATLRRTLQSLYRAVEHALQNGLLSAVEVVIVDNGGDLQRDSFDDIDRDINVLRQTRNLGFGRGHNVAIAAVDSEFHIILNPDVDMDEASLSLGLRWLRDHREVVAIAPDATDDEGSRSYLCRRMPTPAVLFLRSFAPQWVRRACSSMLSHYEMRDLVDGNSEVWDPPVISGCFMFFRTSALRNAGGFDSRYFLYFEDYDLSLRAARLGRIVYLPAVKIVHLGGNASRKGVWHTLMFVRSAIRFFNTYGWLG